MKRALSLPMRILLAALAGTAVVCLCCFLLATLVYIEVLPPEHLTLYAALACLLGGFACGAMTGARERLALYVLVSFFAVSLVLLTLGRVALGSVTVLSDFVCHLALLLGDALGCIAVGLGRR